ncbi:MAG: hypothetical protein WKF84_15100 [Pyrinomonadaceae bacterium]
MTIKLLLLLLTALAKNIHGKSPAYAKRGYGNAVGRNAYEDSEKDGEHKHRKERLNDRPRRADQSLFVANFDVAPEVRK